MRRRSVVVPILILINVIVFFMWFTLGISHNAFMPRNFLVSWTALQQGRWWVVLTSVFSHEALWHILINMVVLYSFGPIMEWVLGRKPFLIFYLVAGVVSSFSHALTSAWLLHMPQLPALGASGAISGVVVLFAFMFPREKILLLGIIPLPALWGALGFIGFDLWGLSAQARGGGLPIGHGAHLGGALTGILYYYFIIRPRKQRASAAARSRAF